MKALQLTSFLVILLSVSIFSFAQQEKSEKMKVAGVCGTCKKKIEKAAKDAGASYAVWNKDTKLLVVRYSSVSTNSAKIQQQIASAGYDTPDFKATEEAYNKLDECCQYERSTTAVNAKATVGKNAAKKSGKKETCGKDCSDQKDASKDTKTSH